MQERRQHPTSLFAHYSRELSRRRAPRRPSCAESFGRKSPSRRRTADRAGTQVHAVIRILGTCVLEVDAQVGRQMETSEGLVNLGITFRHSDAT